MTPQLPLTGLERKERGQQSLERHPWLKMARTAAEAICNHRAALGREPCVTSDVLHDVMTEPPHPNCWGVLFKDKRFAPTGERVRSTRPEAHGREIRVWRLA